MRLVKNVSCRIVVMHQLQAYVFEKPNILQSLDVSVLNEIYLKPFFSCFQPIFLQEQARFLHPDAREVTSSLQVKHS